MGYKHQESIEHGEDRRLGAIRQLGFSVNKLVDGNGYELSVDDCRRSNKDYLSMLESVRESGFEIVGVVKGKLITR